MQTHSSPVMLVTGSAKRIGAGIVQAAHQAGYRVIIHCHHSLTTANQLVAELNDQRKDSARLIQSDLNIIQSSAHLQNFKDTVLNLFGRLDVLVHNASRFYPTPLSTTQAFDDDQHQKLSDDWQELFLTNAKAPLFLTQVFLQELQKNQGCVISLLDIHADGKPFKNYVVYNMAKAAHRMMVQSLALELAPHIRVNGIAPGANIFPDDDSDQAIEHTEQQRIKHSIPLERIGKPEDIAQAVLYLCQADYVTGQILAIDGGRSLTLK